MNPLTNHKSRLYNLEKLHGIENKDANFIKEVLTLFLNTIPAISDELVKAADEKKWDQVYFLAHKMKANIDLLNIESLKKEIRAIEESSKTKNNLDHISDKVKFINSTIEQCAKQIKEDFDGKTSKRVNR
jgi:HPt (histidine-containing phosphotransfer) domain-containing protein